MLVRPFVVFRYQVSHIAWISSLIAELSFRLAQLRNLLMDMGDQHRGDLVGVDPEFRGDQWAYLGRPVEPCVTLGPKLFKQDRAGGLEIDQRA
ncbi:hypothetical protein [Burkholderia gladioli]|uniref:hypothetical protein n=1 Tax=Burkholderia gladioli TaxID=28095 RepID=UPI0015E3AE13|nr:hypothetical protein [Burkholderia gladioli]